jgi:hypothetical protein
MFTLCLFQKSFEIIDFLNVIDSFLSAKSNLMNVSLFLRIKR